MPKESAKEVDQVQTVKFKLTKEGTWIFAWMNPLAEDLIKAMGGKKLSSNSKFCG